MDPLNETECGSSMLKGRVQPNYDLGSLLKYVLHDADLGTPLICVVLVDADSVNPNRLFMISTSYSLKSSETTLRDLHNMSIALYALKFSLFSPGVRYCSITRGFGQVHMDQAASDALTRFPREDFENADGVCALKRLVREGCGPMHTSSGLATPPQCGLSYGCRCAEHPGGCKSGPAVAKKKSKAQISALCKV